jgi:hypothetical protein
MNRIKIVKMKMKKKRNEASLSHSFQSTLQCYKMAKSHFTFHYFTNYTFVVVVVVVVVALLLISYKEFQIKKESNF